ncbi:MAG: TMEM14 family protein [Blastocatellia bacterium]|nr:TMEM14 family protein [Blastocatellia bacterium]
MSTQAIIIIVYGLFVALGGVMGYAKAKSKASLIAGSVSGVLLLASGFILTQGIQAGYYIAMILTVALLGLFAQRFLKTKSFMPAGMMCVISFVVLIVLAIGLF